MIKELITQNIKDIEFRLKQPCFIPRAKKSKSIYQKKKDKLKKTHIKTTRGKKNFLKK